MADNEIDTADNETDNLNEIDELENFSKRLKLDDKTVGVDENGKKILTVDQGAELLKKLSDFTNKRDDILKKLSDISERMEKRMSSIGKEEDEDEFLNPFIQETIDPPHPVNGIGEPGELCQIKVVRTRETKAPMGAGNGMMISMPERLAVDEGYRSSERAEDSFQLGDEGLSHGEKSAVLKGGSKVCLHTGVRASVPNGWMLLVRSLVHGIQILGKDMVSPADTDELVFTVWNYTESDIELEYGKPLFAAFAMKAPQIGCEELLNSTFSDWIAGSIR